MRALITGASSGIGLELARLMSGKHELVLVSKDRKRLESAAKTIKGEVKTIAMDLAQDHAARRLYDKLPKVDILVNNAGFGLFGEFKDTDMGTELEMLHLNIIALTELTKYISRDMIKQKRGRIMNVASTAAFFPGPMMSVYYATKAYVLSFSVALANELKGTGVSLTVLCPGPTESGFQKKANIRDFGKFGLMTSEEVARIGFEGLMKGRLLVIPGMKNRLQVFASHLFPKKTLADMVRIYQG